MYKFNSNNIFVGYLKQLLHTFNLPKVSVYTKEQAEKFRTNNIFCNSKLKELSTKTEQLKRELASETDEAVKKQLEHDLVELNIKTEYYNSQLNTEFNILETVYRDVYKTYNDFNIIEEENTSSKIVYPERMRYFPYIKDGKIQEYSNGRWHVCHETFSEDHYKIHGSKAGSTAVQYYNYNDKILNYTKNLEIQNNIYDSYTHEYLGEFLRFQRDYNNINLMSLYNCFSNRACPKLDLNVTVGPNYVAKFKTEQTFSDALYKYYMVPVKFFKNYTLAIDSEATIEVCCCIFGASQNSIPEEALLTKLTYQCFSNLQFKTPVLYTKIQNLNDLVCSNNSDICQYEKDLKLILKIPVENSSSIVILEGDYTSANNQIFNNTGLVTNRTVVNLETMEAVEYLWDKLSSPLQLLRLNTGESYPFADRLVEYLVGNTITSAESLLDNVIRAKKTISEVYTDLNIDYADGIWEPLLNILVYNYMNKNHDTHDLNFDILGYIDKDVEKLFYSNLSNTNISDMDIYAKGGF